MGDMDTTSLQLLNTIQHRDRRFRLAQTVFMTIVALVLCGVLIALYAQNQSLSDQASDRSKNVQKLLAKQDETIAAQKTEIETTNRYIQCIAQFFATTDRASLALTDLDACRLQRNGQSVGGLDMTPTTGPWAQSGPVVITPDSPGLTPVTPTEPTQPTTPTPTPEPVRILGIPVCVPLTNVCVIR